MNCKALIQKLDILSKQWPKGYWLFANGQSLYLCKIKEDGKRWVTPSGGVHPDSIVASFNIPSDGGDF